MATGWKGLWQGHWKWLLAVAALLAVMALAWSRWQGPQLEVLTVERRDLLQTVVVSGHVEAPHRADIAAQITGTVLRVPVREGQEVQAGDVLVELNPAEAQAAAQQAEAALAQARAQLRQLRELQQPQAEQALRQAQATLDNAQAAAQRSEDLFSQGFVGQAARDDARRSLALADAQWRSARKALEALDPSGSQVALGEAAVSSAQANAAAALARLSYTRVRAPQGGQLIARNVEPGDVVQAGKLLMTLSPQGPTQLVAEVDEKNLRLLQVGQPALASADAYAQRRFAARLAYINPGVNAQTGAVLVKFDLPAVPPELRQDMTVSIDIEVARRPQALLLPVGALHDAETASPWVLRVSEGQAERRAVKLGLRASGWAEVLDGLAEGDRVLPAAAEIAAGDRVRVVKP